MTGGKSLAWALPSHYLESGGTSGSRGDQVFESTDDSSISSFCGFLLVFNHRAFFPYVPSYLCVSDVVF